MKNKKPDIRYMTQVALLAAIIVVLATTPLGLIPLPFVNATTLHIPVILGACLLGPKAGAILGGVFGAMSMIMGTLQPKLTSFVFTPFYRLSPEFHGSWASLIVAFVPRILIGVVAGLVFRALMKHVKENAIAFTIAGFVGSMVNTIGVMGLIYLLFGEQYATALGSAHEALLGAVMLIVGTNGVPEAIVAAVLVGAIGKALSLVYRKSLA